MGQDGQTTARWAELAMPPEAGYPTTIAIRIETPHRGTNFVRVDVLVTPSRHRPPYGLVPATATRLEVRLARAGKIHTAHLDDRSAIRELAVTINRLTPVPPPETASSCPQFAYRSYVWLDFENTNGRPLIELRIDQHDCPPPGIVLMVPGRASLGFEHSRQLIRQLALVLRAHHVVFGNT
jgi:hypothetical protein